MNQTYLHHLLFTLCKIIYKKYSILLPFAFLVVLVLTSSLQAQTLPPQITYQGKLVDNGVPFSGSTIMIFELINPATNTIAWTETQTINIQDGLYSVVLGSQTPFTPNFFSQNPSLGLRVNVNGNILNPITILRAVPYAHSANSVSDDVITSLKIVNGTIQTIDIASGGQNKVLVTDANGLVSWEDRNTIAVETDPTVNLINTDAVPRWNGTALVDGSITDDGTNVNISSSTSINELLVNDLYIGGFNATSITTSGGGGVTIPFADDALVSELAMTDYVASQISTSTFENGVGTLLSGNTGLGGTLTENTSIDGDGFEFELINTDLITLESNGDASIVAVNDIDIEAGQNIGIDAVNDMDIDAGNDINIGASNNVNITASLDVKMQSTGGNVQIGEISNPDSELLLNGWLNLPSLTVLPAPTTNRLYADMAGDLFWEGTQLNNSTTSPFTLTGTVVSRNTATDDFVFGSDQLADAAGTNDNFRMFFDKSKGAFRVGAATGTEWNDVNVGSYSLSVGLNNRASGISSTIVGGAFNIASNQYSNVLGGVDNIASGSNSSVIGGRFLYARSYCETATGIFNTDYTPINTTGFNSNDRLFVIGNGTNPAPINRSNALVVYKDATIELDDSGTPATTTNRLYRSGTDLFWSGINLSVASTNLVAGSGLTDDGTNINLGGLLTTNAIINGNANTYNFSVLDADAISFTGNSFSFNAPPINTGTGANIQLEAQGFLSFPGPIVSNGGTLDLMGGSSAQAGNVELIGGVASTNTGGNVLVKGGNSGVGTGGNATFQGGIGNTGGNVIIRAGNSNTAAAAGNINITGGSGGFGGTITIQGSGVGVGTGNVNIQTSGGNLTIGSASSITTLNGTFTNLSDIRYKKQINTLTNSLSTIQKIRGTKYYWKDETNKQLQFGVIAQEIEEIFPNLVHTNEDGYKSVNYIGLVPVLIEATKEQQTIIDNQKQEINTQKTELENLKKQLSELKVIVASLQENENSNSVLAQKVEQLEKQLLVLVESLSNKTEIQTASLKDEE